jgi:hypothetical protein
MGEAIEPAALRQRLIERNVTQRMRRQGKSDGVSVLERAMAGKTSSDDVFGIRQRNRASHLASRSQSGSTRAAPRS